MPGLELLAVPGLARAVALDDHQAHILDALVGREPAAAGQALAPSADGAAAVGRPGIDHPVVVDTAPWTSHRQKPQDVVAARTLAGARRGRQPAGTTSDCPGTSAPGSTEAFILFDLGDRGARVGAGRDAAGDRPERVARAHDDELLAGGAGASPRRTAPAASGLSSTGDQGDARRSRPCDAGEHTFGAWPDGGRTAVRCQGSSRTYVCTPPGPVLASPSPRDRRVRTVSDITRTPAAHPGLHRRDRPRAGLPPHGSRDRRGRRAHVVLLRPRPARQPRAEGAAAQGPDQAPGDDASSTDEAKATGTVVPLVGPDRRRHAGPGGRARRGLRRGADRLRSATASTSRCGSPATR